MTAEILSAVFCRNYKSCQPQLVEDSVGVNYNFFFV